ncbi:hypothetical protein [Nocardia nepalensis]
MRITAPTGDDYRYFALCGRHRLVANSPEYAVLARTEEVLE